ncbi:iron chaperone [Deinococcus marmoris]|uniref:iron chaperone n=1 Tax=Deinococcus marmoris TaxID=249408 RepID=UPI001115486C|nr:DUF1801 domain-containing protein [Deinococcus marmoris]
MASKTDVAEGFTDAERAAMKERAQELKGNSRRGSRATRGDGASEVLAKLAEMPEPDRVLGERLHALMMACAPDLQPKLWYGMPAYVREGKVVCFFQGAHKFKTRYATLGFSNEARLDDGALWPTAFALMDWTPDTEARITALVQRAVG